MGGFLHVEEAQLRHHLLCLATALVLTGSIWADPGVRETGFVLLREGVGARAAGMGEAYTAVAGDQTAAYWNPAGVAVLNRKDFVLMHQRSLQGINQAYGGWATGNEKRGLALSLAVYSVGGFEARTEPTLEPLGTFGVYDLNAGVSYGQRFGQRTYFGFAVKALHENIESESAWGLGVDLGLMMRFGIPGLTAGVSYRNLGRMEVLDQKRTPLPRTVRFGASYVRNTLTLSADYRLPEKGNSGANVGLEYVLNERLFLRGGFITGHDTRSWSLGMGVTRRNWRVDYAFVPLSSGLGGAHRVALGIR
jgi:hypothetical protein